MDTLIRNLFLNQWFLVFVLGVIFAMFSSWAMRESRLGYALGWLMGVFFVVVYTALGGADPVQRPVGQTLNLLQVIFPTLCGIFMGGGMILLVALVRTNRERERALLIAFLTALNLSLLFLVLVEGQTTQLMIGIYALAFGIVALFGAILSQDSFANGDDSGGSSGQGGGGGGRSAQDIRNNRPRTGRSRVDQMRDDMDNR